MYLSFVIQIRHLLFPQTFHAAYIFNVLEYAKNRHSRQWKMCDFTSNGQRSVGTPAGKSATVAVEKRRRARPAPQDLTTTAHLETCLKLRWVVATAGRTEGTFFGFGSARDAQSARPLCVGSACGTPSSQFRIAV